MEINYLGHASFRLKGKSATVVCDPYTGTGLKFPKHTQADIVTISHEHADHNEWKQVEGDPYVVRGPGEYDIKGVGVIGILTHHDEEKGATRGNNTVYRIEIDGVTIVHLGDLGHGLTAAQVDELDGVDVLLVPVGGTFTIDAAKAVEVINEIEPSIVIPMHYGREDLAHEFKDLAPVTAFLKEIGREDVQPQPKLVITKDKIPEQMQVVLLS